MGNKIAIILALVLGFMAVYLVKSHLDKTKKEFIGEVIQVVVARDKIEKGVEIREEKLAPRSVPARFLRGSRAYERWDKRTRLIGGTTAFEITPGEFITQRMIVIDDPGLNKGGIHVNEGLRAYTISASGENAVAGLVIIGDRVDIMGTFLILGAEQGLQGVRSQKARTMYLMQDIEIKALDQVTSGRIKEGSFGMITFELDPLECLVLEFAQNTGKIKLVKRNAEDRFAKYNPDHANEVHRENLMDFIKIASQRRATRIKDETGN